MLCVLLLQSEQFPPINKLCSTHLKVKQRIQVFFFLENAKERDRLEGVDIDGRILLK